MCVGPNHTNYINRKLNFSAVTRIKVLLSFCMVRRISSEIQYLIWWWIRGEHWPDSSGQCPPDVFKKRYIEVVDAWHMLFAIEHRELTTTTTREQSSPQKGTAIRLAESLFPPVQRCSNNTPLNGNGRGGGGNGNGGFTESSTVASINIRHISYKYTTKCVPSKDISHFIIKILLFSGNLKF